MKIVVLDGYTLNPGDLSWEGLERFGELTVYDRTSYNLEGKDLIIARCKGAEVIFTNKTPINKEILDNLPNLKYIGVLATGYNIVDVVVAKEKGIVVTNIPSYGTSSVAQMTFALLLEMTNNAGAHSISVSNGDWQNNKDWSYWKHPLVELAGKTLGIIGYGRIGQSVGKIAQAFDMKVIAMANNHIESLVNENMRYAELDDLLSKADIISLHCPLNDSTVGIINKHNINKMKHGVMLINTSRGQLVVEADLAKALNDGKVGGAALDVLSSEPPNSNNPLLKAKNCIITPHISWAPIESRRRLMGIAIQNLEAFIEGEELNSIMI